MADIRVRALYAEVAFSSGVLTRMTKQSFEAAIDNAQTNTAAQIKVPFLFGEVAIAINLPQLVRMTKQALEALVDNSQTNTAAAIRVPFLFAEAAFGAAAEVRLTKQALEVLVDNSEINPVADIQLAALYAEVAIQRGPAAPVPLTDPAGLDFFVHNWADQVEVTTSYLTDVTMAQDTLAEERRALWSRPIRTLRFSWLQNEPEWMLKLLATLRRLPNERLAMPLYQDQMELTAGSVAGITIYVDTTEKRIFVGQRVLIAKFEKDRSRISTYDLRRVTYKAHDYIEVDSPTSFDLDPVGVIVFPTIDTEINLKSEQDFITQQVGKVSMEVTEVVGPSALPPLQISVPEGMNMFRGDPIWDFEHNWATPFRTSFVRDGRNYTQGRGTIIDPQGARHRSLFAYDVGPVERPEFMRLVRFFDYCRGRVRPFWVIDQENNWNLQAINGAGSFLDIEAIGDFDDFADEFDFVGLVLADGTRVIEQVVDVQDLGSTYRLTLNTAVSGFSAGDVVQLARARQCRLNSDEMKESWINADVASTSMELVELLEEKDADLG